LRKFETYLILLMASLGALEIQAQVVISELMPANSALFNDELGDTPDWLELHNTANEEINIYGWHLSDNEDELSKWQIPNLTLQPYEYVVVICNGDDFLENTSFLQASFKLDKSGEEIFLSNQNLEINFSIKYDCVPENRSFGLVGDNLTSHFYVPSPGGENVFSTSFDQVNNSVQLSHPAGLYENEFMLEVSDDLSHEIRFTNDGSYPEGESHLSAENIHIQSQFVNEGISYIPSAEDWIEPKQDVFIGNNLKFITYHNGCPSSPMVHADYFVRDDISEVYPLPVYSLTFEEDELFGDNGILVPGTTGLNYLGDGEVWERRAHLQLFNSLEGRLFESEVDVRVRGRGSRNNSQKSLKIYGRSEGKKAAFDYPFFSEREVSDYRRIVLRSGHSDFTKAMIKDVLSAELVEKLDVEFMESETSIVFMNGEYWGIQNARENMGKFYLESFYGVNPEALDIVKVEDNGLVALEGSASSFSELIVFSENNDLAAEANYEYITNRIELTNFIDYHIAELFFANWDWPQNNQKVWKSHEPNSKFRWLFYDCDGCFYIHSLDRLSELDFESDDTPFGFKLLSNLLRNKKFRRQFHARYLELINSDFSAVNMLSKIDSLEALYAPVILEHINRWSSPDSYTAWKENLSEMRVFALQRSSTVLYHLDKLFGNPVLIYPNPSNDFLYIDAGIEEAVLVNIMDSRGVLIRETMVTTEVPLNVESMDAGIYMIVVYLGNLVFSKKFIKE
jgi:hypothetical protein